MLALITLAITIGVAGYLNKLDRVRTTARLAQLECSKQYQDNKYYISILKVLEQCQACAEAVLRR